MIKWIGFIIDTLFGIAIRADDMAERRRLRKKIDKLGKALERDRMNAETVVVRRPSPPPR